MNKLLITSTALIAAFACTAAAQPGHNRASPYAPSAECAIDVTRTRHGIRFEALARSPDRALGDYELVITKHDRGGSSDIVQGGQFDLRPGREAVLGESELSLERGGRYRARLVLWDADGAVCRSERRS